MPKIVDKKSIFKTKSFEVIETDVELTSGDRVNYNYINLGESAMMVPINNKGEVLLIREYFQTLDQVKLSLPKGRMEDGMDPESTANKELQEEIGFKAGKLDKLGVFNIAPGYVSLDTHIFLARDLTESKLEGDWDEEIELVPTPFEKIDELISKGEITEARVIAALLLARNLLNK